LKEIADKLKNYGPNTGNRDDEELRRSKNKRNREPSEEERKEALVIWGSLEVPKLFATSHQS
jgi:hypothetical protein